MALFRSAIAPIVNPANDLILIVGQVAQYTQRVVQHQVQHVIAVLRMNAAGQAVHGDLIEAPGLFPEVRLALVLGQFGVQPLLRVVCMFGQGCRWCLLLRLDPFSRHLSQPLLGHVRGQQVRPAGIAFSLAQVNRLHEVVTLRRRTQHLLALFRGPRHFGIGHVQRAGVEENEIGFVDWLVAIVVEHSQALPQHGADQSVVYAVLGQGPAAAFNYIQPAIAQQPNPQRPDAEAVRHRDFARWVQRRIIDDAVTQGDQLHGGLHQWAGAHAVTRILSRETDVVGVLRPEGSRH